MSVERILIVGGYGVVGSRLARIARRRHPGVEVLVGGRRPALGEALARELGGAEAVEVDVGLRDPLAKLPRPVDLVVATANDPDDRLLLAAVDRRLAYVDICRWTERLGRALERLAVTDIADAPLVFASSWMGGGPATVARGLVEDYASVRRIDLNILYALADRSGPNSVAYIDRLDVPFRVREDGRERSVKSLRDGLALDFPGAGRFPLYRFDSVDRLTLPLITDAESVTARIGFDDRFTGRALSLLVRSGFWSLIGGQRFEALRRRLLHNPGRGAPHRIRIDVEGTLPDGRLDRQSWLIEDPEGQSHLAAVGGAIQLDRLIALRNAGLPCRGVQIAEAVTSPRHALSVLGEEGVAVTRLA